MRWVRVVSTACLVGLICEFPEPALADWGGSPEVGSAPRAPEAWGDHSDYPPSKLHPPYPPPLPIPVEPPGRPSPPTLGDDLWDDRFGLPSPDGAILCAVRYRGDLIVGGEFRTIGGVAANCIARWDGNAWHPLSGGIGGSSVTALAVHDDRLFVGGDFLFVGETFSPNVAYWDGRGWTSAGVVLGSYLCCQEVHGLARYRESLIAGGLFRQDGGATHGLVRWDGTRWNLFEQDVPGAVTAMLVEGESLYVAGRFQSAGGVAASNVALWDGVAWSPLGTGLVNPNYSWDGARSIARYKGSLYVTGYFDSAGGVWSPGLARWDGTAWGGLGDSTQGWATTLAIHEDLLLIPGGPGISRWDGSSFVAGIPGLTGSPLALLVDGGDLLAVGIFQVEGSDQEHPAGFGIAWWAGSRWRTIEAWDSRMKGLALWPGRSADVRALASYRGSLAVAGYVEYAGSVSGWKYVGPLALWNGADWDRGAPSPPGWAGTPAALFAEADTLLLPGEYWSYAGQGFPWIRRRPVQRWDGISWSDIDTLSLMGTSATRYRESTVVGMVTQSYYLNPNAGVYALRGGTWERLGITEHSESYHGVRCMTVHDGELIAAGRFTAIDGVPANGVAAWDGKKWRALGALPGSFGRVDVYGVASTGSRLFASGMFRTNSGAPALMEWDGTSWTSVPGLSGFATEITVVRDRVVLTGNLRLDSTFEVARIVMRDGERWVSLGSGVNGSVNAIAEWNGGLYFAGNFSTSGGKPSYSIAKWNGVQPLAPARRPWLSPGRPNPFLAGSDFTFRLETETSVRIAVHDARGRQVAVLDDGFRVPGTHAIRWDGRDATGREVPAGVYFISVRSREGAVASRKVVRLR